MKASSFSSWFLLCVGITASVAYLLYLFCLTAGSSDGVGSYFDLISDTVPSREGKEIIGNDALGDKQRNILIQAAIQQRLFAGYRDLAYAASGKWSLATWAQLQSVRDTLDGNERSNANVDKRLMNFSFVRLLNEFYETAAPIDQPAAADALRDGKEIVRTLASMRPSSKYPTETLQRVVAAIETAPGLSVFVTGFPKLKEISVVDR